METLTPWNNGEPLVDAYLACLEAASSIGRAMEHARQDRAVPSTEAAQEALYASRAAATAIRFSLVELTDRIRGGDVAKPDAARGPLPTERDVRVEGQARSQLLRQPPARDT
ncbi:hypothetical protein [Amycolatopsis cihanbeyliensis]|uniref:hypothetical protein n=1 Tax=Amycolatopsis cihanbeyliensis TaxID=1128664 RepID=UPI00115007BF|nr:hypothetical protein [Amycolatopsis cihanbeyliensis]